MFYQWATDPNMRGTRYEPGSDSSRVPDSLEAVQDAASYIQDTAAEVAAQFAKAMAGGTVPDLYGLEQLVGAIRAHEGELEAALEYLGEVAG